MNAMNAHMKFGPIEANYNIASSCFFIFIICTFFLNKDLVKCAFIENDRKLELAQEVRHQTFIVAEDP